MKPITIIFAGLISGIITTTFTISLVGLIFTGQLTAYIPLGVGWFLAGAVILGTWIALTSSYAGNIASPQGKPAIVMALAVAAIADSVTIEQLLPTVSILIVTTSLLTGLCLYLLGHFQMGNLTRFIPYPVIGGFQVGTGWLVIVGAFSVLTGYRLNLENLTSLINLNAVWHWLPALAYALIMWFVLRYRAHFLSLFLLLLGGILAFYLMVWSSGQSLLEIRAAGWFLTPFPEDNLWQPLQWSAVNWRVIASQAPIIMAIVLLVTTDVLLNSASIETSTQTRLDLNQELKSTGLANFATGWVGGLAGYNAISLCLLNHKIGASHRLTAMMSALVCGLFLLCGAVLLDYFPVVVLGGLLLFLGLAFMSEWLWDGWSRLSLTDYLLVLVIWFVIANWGFIEGISVGLIIAMILFIINYSRINVVKWELSGKKLRSHRERPAAQAYILDQQGQQIRIFKLHGFIFFGTANNLLEQYRNLVENKVRSQPSIRFVILDFRAIIGIDSSAVASFRQMLQLSSNHNIHLLFANVPAHIAGILDRYQLRKTTLEIIGEHTQLDHCLEWCEDQILSEQAAQLDPPTLVNVFSNIFTVNESHRFQQILTQQTIAQDELLFHEGDPSHSLYFIKQGQVVAWVTDSLGQQERLQSLGAGSIVGEMGFYTDAPRSATVIAAESSVLLRLTRESLNHLKETDLSLVVTFNNYIVCLLAKRLQRANHTLKFLSR